MTTDKKMKTCRKCGRTLPVGQFHRTTCSRDGYENLCCWCQRKDSAARIAAIRARRLKI